MQAAYVMDRSLGYVQSSAVDAATTIASLFPGGVIPSGTQLLLVQPQTQAIRWRDDGTAPTASIGYPLAVGAELRYTGQTAKLQVISQTAGAIVNVVAYGTSVP